MRSLLSIASWVLFFSENVHAIIHISPQNVSGNAQTWDLSRKSRCLVLAHQSLVLKNDEHHLLILDGGFGRFNLKFNGSDADVNDLNPYTAAFDLSKDFKLYELEPLWQSKKTRDIPVLSQFGLWSDSTQNRLYMNGGHFFAESKWQGSDFYIPKEQIPPYNIYEFDLISRSWKPSLTSSDAKRTFSGASATIPSLNQSFFLGGITDSYTSASSKLQVFETQSQLVHFDHTSHQLDVRKYYADDETEGYWHGTLEHIPVGCDDGLLISLMSQKNDLNTQHSDLTASNDEAGFAVSWETVRLYDVRGKRWYQQNTSWPDDGPPPTRTRFCSSVVHDKELNTWDLWVHGGQQLGANSTEGVDDIWVLSMPSFTWVRLPTVVPRENRLRSHKCHAVGGQLLLVGGYPPEDDLDKDDPPCDPFIVKVLDMNAVIPEVSVSMLDDNSREILTP